MSNPYTLKLHERAFLWILGEAATVPCWVLMREAFPDMPRSRCRELVKKECNKIFWDARLSVLHAD